MTCDQNGKSDRETMCTVDNYFPPSPRPESYAEGGDGRWGREDALGRRASSPDGRWRRGRASGLMAAVVAEKSKVKVIARTVS